MKKIAIFNIGGALSSYLEFDDIKVVIDLGASADFSPVDNFLIPLAEKRSFKSSLNYPDKFAIDQLFISHLDKDHISDYEKFKNKFQPDLMTCPNDNEKIGQDGEKQQEHYRVNVDKLGEENDMRNMILEDMRGRQPITSNEPLATKSENIKLFFIKPKECEENEELTSCYANNISLVLFVALNEKTILLPGDILKDGMKYLIENRPEFKKELNDVGIDYLVAPHHGLATSFPECLFQEIKGNKTRLNIISEKVRTDDSEENRSDVDGRYYSSDYSTADNDLTQNAVKTSMGHIVINLETGEGEVKQIKDNEELLNEFLS